jgi:uncharacterized membrane protein YqhA
MRKLLGLKYVLIPTIFFMFIISLIFTLRGIMLCSEVIWGLISGDIHFITFSEIENAEPPALLLMEAVDFFLLSFVFFIFSFGLFKIFFIGEIGSQNENLPKWLRINSMFELKTMLWQSVLTTMLVIFLNGFVIMISQNNMNWQFLVLPVSILIIAVALYFMKLGDKD